MKFNGKEPIEVTDNIKFEMQLRLLQNVKGIYVNGDNCSALYASEDRKEPLNLDDVSLDKKSQLFWI
jgi:hypothetical protein